jgi:hypothetical protein
VKREATGLLQVRLLAEERWRENRTLT